MTALGLTLTILIVLAVSAYLWSPVQAWRRYRGARLVPCPETGRLEAVSIDLGLATFTALTEGRPSVHLAGCSRWTERGRCDEPCLADVESAGLDGAVVSIVERWYHKATCRYCGQPIESACAARRPAALMGPDGITVEWSAVAPERLPEMFRTHQPVCWSCHLAETFWRTHADLVVDRTGAARHDARLTAAPGK
jgi:hypothetical protein